MKVTVKPSLFDVCFGQRKHPNRCPMARALRRAFPDMVSVVVGHRSVYVNFADGRQIYCASNERLAAFIERFDFGSRFRALFGRPRVELEFTNEPTAA